MGRVRSGVRGDAWHWLDPETKYQRAHRHLRPGGALAFWSAAHVVPVDGDPFFVELQEIYDEIGESLPSDWRFPKPGELADQIAEITVTGLFAPVVVRHLDWETTYDADGYITLLDTFSGHRTMRPWQHQHLYDEIRRRLCQTTNRHRPPPLGRSPPRRHPIVLTTHDSCPSIAPPALNLNCRSAGAAGGC